MMLSSSPVLAERGYALSRPRTRKPARGGRGVIHIDLAAPFPDHVEPGPFQRSMVVFWWRDIPLGHVFVESHRCSPERIAALAESAVEDDLITLAEDRMPASGQRPLPVSVVVCTRDRPQELGGCLDSLLAQKLPPEEIVVVDDGSAGPATRRVAAERPRTVYRRQEPLGLSAARNTAIRAARHELIAFTEDTARHHPLWLERLVQPLEEGAVAAAGLVLPYEMESEAQYVGERAWSLGHGYRARSFGPAFLDSTPGRAAPVWEIGSGVSMAFRRSALQQAGGFDERLDCGTSSGAGEAELWQRLLAQGWTCRYEPASVAYCRHPRALEDLADAVRARMAGHVAALLIQLERHGRRGDLRRVAIDLPKLLIKLGWSRIRHGRRPHTAMFGAAVQGYCAGLAGMAGRSGSTRD